MFLWCNLSISIVTVCCMLKCLVSYPFAYICNHLHHLHASAYICIHLHQVHTFVYICTRCIHLHTFAYMCIQLHACASICTICIHLQPSASICMKLHTFACICTRCIHLHHLHHLHHLYHLHHLHHLHTFASSCIHLHAFTLVSFTPLELGFHLIEFSRFDRIDPFGACAVSKNVDSPSTAVDRIDRFDRSRLSGNPA